MNRGNSISAVEWERLTSLWGYRWQRLIHPSGAGRSHPYLVASSWWKFRSSKLIMNRLGEGKLKILRPIFPSPQIFHLTTQTLIPNESIGANFHSNSRQQHENFARNSNSCSDSTFCETIFKQLENQTTRYSGLRPNGSKRQEVGHMEKVRVCMGIAGEWESKAKLHKDEIEASNTSLKDPTCCTRCRRAAGFHQLFTARHRHVPNWKFHQNINVFMGWYVAYQDQEHKACIPLVDSFLFIHSGMT